MLKGKTLARNGGCWYCHNNNEESEKKGLSRLIISKEWDCFVHPKCIMDRLKEDPEDSEAEIFSLELGLI